ncbi:MAG: ABC transporter permease [Blastocatellia bacterium]
MQTLFQDLRYGARMLLKQPGFTLIAVLTLALGIGANTAIFTVVNATLANGLPYREPEQLVHLWERTPQADFPRREASYPDFLDWRKSQALAGVAAYAGCQMILQNNAEPQPVPCASVSANFFALLGVEPMLGRLFTNEEEQSGVAKVLLITHSAWQQRFGGDPKLIGQPLRINDEPWTVIGVLPPSFHFAPRGPSEFWQLIAPSESRRQRRGMHWVKVIGRLRSDDGSAQAQAELQTIGSRIAGQFPDSHTNTSVFSEPLQQEVIGSVKPLMFALLAAVALVLLIACANVANLLLVRSAARQKELAIRLALGANRAAIVRQLLTESLLLALIGGAFGVLLARWGVDALIAAIPEVILSGMPYLRDLSLDGRVLAFTSGLTILTSMVFGLAPALQASKPALQTALKEGGRSSAGSGKRLQQMLVAGEIALALMLLIGAGLMIKSTLRLSQLNPGFNPEKLLLLSFTTVDQKYRTPEAQAVFQQQLLERAAAVPGVRGVAAIDVVPLTGGNTSLGYAAGRPIPPPDEMTEFNYRVASDNYFRVMEVPLLQGRYFNAQDNPKSPGIIIVNQTLAQRMFPGESAIGQRITLPGRVDETYEIVGVVGDERINGLAAPIKPVIYRPFSQDSDNSAVMLARTTADPMKLAETIRRECLAVEPGLVIFFTRSMENLAANLPATFMRRYPALLLGVFAGLALLMAAIGIYGVMSYSVTQRTPEIGIRVALGAQTRDVLRLVIGQGVKLILAGIVLGLLAAYALTRLLKSLLFGVSATDLLTFASVALLLAVVALLACWIPARRATKVDPMIALRCE